MLQFYPQGSEFLLWNGIFRQQVWCSYKDDSYLILKAEAVLVDDMASGSVDGVLHSAACSKGATNVKYEMAGSQRTRKHTSRTKVSLTE